MVSPSCKPFNAPTRFVSFGPGLTLLAVLTVMTAACVTAQSRTSVTVEKRNVSCFKLLRRDLPANFSTAIILGMNVDVGQSINDCRQRRIVQREGAGDRTGGPRGRRQRY